MTVVRAQDPPIWRLLVTALDLATLTVLDGRSGDRAFTFTLGGPAAHSGLVASDDPEINLPYPAPTDKPYLTNNSRLIFGLRRETRQIPGDDPWVCRYAGLLMSLEDEAADAPTSRYTAYDPWQLLFSRPVRTLTGALPKAQGIRYSDTRGSVMALDLLAATELIDGSVLIDSSDGSLIEATDVIDGVTQFDRGLSVGEAWQQLIDTGTIDIILQPIYQPGGSDPPTLCQLVIRKPTSAPIIDDAIFGWDIAGNSVTDVSRMIDGTRLANRVLFYAGDGGNPVTLQSDAASIAAYGEYWSQQFAAGTGFPGFDAGVVLMALAQLQLRKQGGRSIVFSPAPERAPLVLRDYGLGDYVPLWTSRAMRDPIGIDFASVATDPGARGYQRVYGIPIELDDDGTERVRGILTSADSSGEG